MLFLATILVLIVTIIFLSQRKPLRYLIMDGEAGYVVCRLHNGHNTVPKLSEARVFESASRTILRMNNLCVFRGIPGASMVGPLNYYGNLENPHLYNYTISIDGGTAQFIRHHPYHPVPGITMDKVVPASFATQCSYKWRSGHSNAKNQPKIPRTTQADSLFPNPGELILSVDDSIRQPSFDARGYDLTPYRARLVNNNTPFHITHEALPSKDYYRVISYFYQPKYKDWQVNNGSGIFLEYHQFTQTMTPLDSSCTGFVTLARVLGNKMEFISVQIPYGWTLIISDGCIHGDTTLKGHYIMCMTSDHTTMATADTVFLRNKHGKNLDITETNSKNISQQLIEDGPLYVYNEDTTGLVNMKQRLHEEDLVYNPFSKGYRLLRRH